MLANTSLFKVIERLSENLPFDPAKVAEILGTRLEPDPEGDTPVSTSYVQPAEVTDSLYEEVELRIPDPQFGNDGGVLKATLKNDVGIDSDAIFAQYGLDFQQDVPSPRNPPGLPTYYNYEQPWGTLSLGVTSEEADKLVAFVMKPKPLG